MQVRIVINLCNFVQRCPQNLDFGLVDVECAGFNLVDNFHVFSGSVNLEFFVVLLVPLFKPLKQCLFIHVFAHPLPLLLKPVSIRKHSCAANSENRSSNLARRTEPKPNCSRNVCNASCSNRSYASCTRSMACLTVMRLS